MLYEAVKFEAYIGRVFLTKHCLVLSVCCNVNRKGGYTQLLPLSWVKGVHSIIWCGTEVKILQCSQLRVS